MAYISTSDIVTESCFVIGKKLKTVNRKCQANLMKFYPISVNRIILIHFQH